MASGRILQCIQFVMFELSRIFIIVVIHLYKRIVSFACIRWDRLPRLFCSCILLVPVIQCSFPFINNDLYHNIMINTDDSNAFISKVQIFVKRVKLKFPAFALN